MAIASDRGIRIGILGAGLIGRARLQAVQHLNDEGYPCHLVGLYDPFAAGTADLAAQYKMNHWQSMADVIAAKVDWLIVCIPHDQVVGIVPHFLQQGTNVLLEKPLGRNIVEAKALIKHCQHAKQLAVGFNYRFYAGIQQAYHDIKNDVFGDLIAINMVLGHGGKPEDKSSWKLNLAQCGGGALLDPGIHLLDLATFFTQGATIDYLGGGHWRGFWQTGIEEECQLLLRANRTMINITSSVVRWRSTFRIEIQGTAGYGLIEGRDRSYGAQRYTRGKRWGWQSGQSQAQSEERVLINADTDVFAEELRALWFKEDAQISPCYATEALVSMQLWQTCHDHLLSEKYEDATV